MLTQSRSSLSVDKVASNDDLVTEILSRLPVRSILRFMSVSKHWYFLTKNPSFRLLRSRIPDPPTGVFVPIRTNKPYVECEFIPFDVENPVKAPFRTLDFDPNVKRIDIEHSCNGLMLCSSQTTDDVEANRSRFYKYYIYNPTINQFITLPRFENYDKSVRFGMTIAFDPSKSPHYRIIYVYRLSKNYITNEGHYHIEIFSSETGACEPFIDFPYDERIGLDFRSGVYCNNAIYWLQKFKVVLCVNLDEESFYAFDTPCKPHNLEYENCSNFKVSHYIFESRDKLLLVEIYAPFTSEFRIFEMARDHSAWSVKYHVNLEVVYWSYPEIMNPCFPLEFLFVVQSIVLGEKEDDSFLVLQIPGKALRFNLASKTFHTLRDFKASSSSNDNGELSQWPDVYQFTESLYSV